MHSHDRTLTAQLGFADPDKRNHKHDLACQYLSRPELSQRLLEPFFGRHLMKDDRDETESIYDSWNGRQIQRTVRVVSEIIEGPTVHSVANEFHLTKGDGKYSTTIGFLDVVIFGYVVVRDVRSWDQDEVVDNPERKRITKEIEEDADYYFGPGNRDRPWEISPERRTYIQERIDNELRPVPQRITVKKPKQTTSVNGYKKIIAIEVKASPASIGDLLRQFKLYDTYDSSLINSFRTDKADGFVTSQPRLTWILATLFDISDVDVEALRRADIRHVRLGPQFEEWCAEQQRVREQDGPSNKSLIL